MTLLCVLPRGPFVLPCIAFCHAWCCVTNSVPSCPFASSHSLYCFQVHSMVHSWFLSFKDLMSSFFLHLRRCMAQRSTFLYVSLPPESSTAAILPPSTASTCSHPPPLVAAGIPSKGRKTHSRSKSRIMSLYSMSSSVWFCPELWRPGRRLISNKCASGVALPFAAASPGTAGGCASRKSRPKNSKWSEEACMFVYGVVGCYVSEFSWHAGRNSETYTYQSLEQTRVH